MTIGKGKYDDLATYVRETAEAEGVLLLVLRGKLGTGFVTHGNLVVQLSVPGLLRDMADEIEKDLGLIEPEAANDHHRH